MASEESRVEADAELDGGLVANLASHPDDVVNVLRHCRG